VYADFSNNPQRRVGSYENDPKDDEFGDEDELKELQDREDTGKSFSARTQSVGQSDRQTRSTARAMNASGN
jgi:hypothetical protein